MESNNNSKTDNTDNTNKNSLTNKQNVRPCCVCKDTRTARDDCLRFNPEETCIKQVNAHNECLKSYGFQV